MKRRWRSTTMLPHVRQQTKKNSLNWLGWVRFDKDVTPLHSVLRVARKVETILTMNHSSSLNDCENVLFFCTPSSRARAKQIATKITHKDRNFDMRREKKNRLVWQLSDVEKSSSCDDKSPLRSNILQFAFLAFDLLKRNKKKLFARLLALFVHSLFDYHDTTSDSRVSIWLLFFCVHCLLSAGWWKSRNRAHKRMTSRMVSGAGLTHDVQISWLRKFSYELFRHQVMLPTTRRSLSQHVVLHCDWQLRHIISFRRPYILSTVLFHV